MSDDTKTSRRLDDLEAHIAHQDATIDDLNAVLLRQWKAIEALNETLRRLEARIAALADSAEEEGAPDPPPPHY